MSSAALIVVCLDGADDRVVKRLIDQGRLPALAELSAHGVCVSMETEGVAMPEHVWGPALTGSSVGDHAFIHFHEFEPETMGLRFQREAHDLEPFWLHLPGRGAGGVVLDVPEIYPHPSSCAEESCCWHQHDPAHRPFVTSRALRRLLGPPERLPHPPEELHPSLAGERKISRQLVASAGRRALTLARVGTDRAFTCIGVSEPHTAVHALGHHWDPDHWHRPFEPEPELLEAPYVALDAALGPVLNRHRDANVVVVAAGGMRPAGHGHHFLEGLLTRAGLCQLRGQHDAQASPSSDAGPRPGAGVALLRAARALIPDSTREAITTAMLPEALQHKLASRAFADRYHWPRTHAFPVPSWGPGWVRLNIAGRESAGIVEPGRAKPLLDELSELIEGLECADTGRRLARRVFAMQETYPGQRSGCLPDLGVEWAIDTGLVTRVSHRRLGTWSAPICSGHPWSEHRGESAVFLAGPDIRARDAVLEEDVCGLAPTLLALRGVRRPSAMIGRPWGDALAA